MCLSKYSKKHSSHFKLSDSECDKRTQNCGSVVQTQKNYKIEIERKFHWKEFALREGFLPFYLCVSRKFKRRWRRSKNLRSKVEWVGFVLLQQYFQVNSSWCFLVFNFQFSICSESFAAKFKWRTMYVHFICMDSKGQQ